MLNYYLMSCGLETFLNRKNYSFLGNFKEHKFLEHLQEKMLPKQRRSPRIFFRDGGEEKFYKKKLEILHKICSHI